MSPFKKAAVKGGSSKGKEPVIDVDDFSPQPRGTRSSSKRFDPDRFRSYAAYQSYENFFLHATPLLERALDQSSLHDTDIPKWFAHKDWNYLLSDPDDAYEELVKEFYANAIVEGDELKCWVRKKSFSISPAYLAEILHINRPIFRHSPVYDDLCPDEELLKESLGPDLEFSPNGKSISVSSLSPKLRVLTIVMFHNLYPLSSTGYMNLGRALFLHDLISDVEIDICAHIFHVLRKTVLRNESRICVPFCSLISRILKLKGVYPMDDESPMPKPSPINMRTFNASIGHSRKRAKPESSASHNDSQFNSLSLDGKLERIVSSVHELNTKLSGLTASLHHQSTRWDMKFTSLQTQLDQIQRKLEEDD